MTLAIDSIAYTAFWFGIISACSLPLGSLTTLIWKPSDRATAFLMAFGGGALLAALAIDLVAGTVAKGHFYPLAAGCIIGGLIFIALNRVVNDFGGFLRKASTQIYHLRRLEHRRIRQILSTLKRVDVFQDLSDGDFRILAASIQSRDVKKRAVIFSQEDPCDCLYIIADGKVELLDPMELVTSRLLEKNDDLGWLAFITGTPYRFTARAMENTTLWVLPRYAFFGLLSNSPDLLQAVHIWLRSPKVTNYLLSQHHLSAEATREWSDTAVHQLLQHGIYSNAVAINHKSKSFQVIADHIGRLDIFNHLPRDEQEAITTRLIFKQYVPGDPLFNKDDDADRMFIIEHGAASLLDAIDHFGNSIDIKAEDTLGFMAFLTGGRHTMSAIALKETGVWTLRRQDFNDLLNKLPELGKQVKLFFQQDRIAKYLTERQHLSHINADIWKNKAIKSITAGKEIVPVSAFNFNVSEHQGAPLGIWLGLMLDGIPEALVIGSSLGQSGLGFSLLAGLFFSNYPEALSSSVGMREQGMKFRIILLMWTSLMLITGILSALGSIYFAGVSHSVFAFTEGLAAGAMLTMIAQTMLPEAYFKGGEIIGFSTLLGFLCAIFFKTLE